MKTKAKPNREMLIEDLEHFLSNYYGTQFLIDLQEIAGLHTLREYFGKGAETNSKRDEYCHLLRGAWYAANQKSLTTKK